MNQSNWYRYLLSEITTLPENLYKDIEDELEQSTFWLQPHAEDDIVKRKSALTTSIQHALDRAFANNNLNVVAKIVALKGSENPSPEDSSSFVAGASYHIKSGNIGVVEIYLYPFPDEDFEFDYETFIDSISEVVRHELIHAGQAEKRAKRSNISLARAGRRIGSDKRDVPRTSESDPQYQEVYHSRKNEIEAYAHQTAEYLIKLYGQDNALKYMSMPSDDPRIPEDVRDLQVWEPLRKRPKALKRLKNRIYAYILHLTQK